MTLGELMAGGLSAKPVNPFAPANDRNGKDRDGSDTRSAPGRFFAIIMLSLIDTFIQNPVGNPSASRGFVEAFPAFAPTQVAVAGGFTDRFPAIHLLLGLAWPAGFAMLATVLFGWHVHLRMRRCTLWRRVQLADQEPHTYVSKPGS